MFAFCCCLDELVRSGAADTDAGELVSDALSEAWPHVSELLLLLLMEEGEDGDREENAGAADLLLCRLLQARVPEAAAKVAAFVAFVSRLAGDSDKGKQNDPNNARPPPLPPSIALERIVLPILQDPRRRESDAAVASAAKLGVKLLLLLEEEEEGAKAAAKALEASRELAPSALLPQLVRRACELFAERGNDSSLSPATSALCGELAAAAAAAAASKNGCSSPLLPPLQLPWRARLSAPSLLLLPEELPPSLAQVGTCCSSSDALSVASDLCALAWGSAGGEEAVLRAAAKAGKGEEEPEPPAAAAAGGAAASSAASLLLSRLRSFRIRASHHAIEREISRTIPVLHLAEAERLTLRALPEMLRATTATAATATAAAATDAATSSPLASLPRSAFRALSIEMLCRIAAAGEGEWLCGKNTVAWASCPWLAGL